MKKSLLLFIIIGIMPFLSLASDEDELFDPYSVYEFEKLLYQHEQINDDEICELFKNDEWDKIKKEIIDLNPNHKCHNNETISSISIRKGNIEIFNILKTKGADILHQDSYDTSILHWASRIKGNKNLVEEILKNGADPNHENKWGWTPLYMGIISKDHLLVKTLINHGANIELGDMSFFSVLSAGDQLKIFGSAIQYATEYNSIVGFAASHHENSKVIKLLIEHGADPDEKYHPLLFRLGDEKGVEPLYVTLENSIRKNDHTNIKALLESGANPNPDVYGLYGNSFLHEIILHINLEYKRNKAKENHKKIIKLAIDYGADLNFKNKENYKPFHYVKNKDLIDDVDSVVFDLNSIVCNHEFLSQSFTDDLWNQYCDN